MFAALGWTAQQHFKAALRPDADEWRKKHITMENAMKAGFQRSAWASIMPGVMDTAMQIAGGDKYFDQRGSGLSSSFVDSSPTVDLGMKAYKGFTAATKSARSDTKQFSRADANNVRYSLPMANAWFTTHLWNMAIGAFPESGRQ
jgi:hypothetical protein